MVQGRLDEEEEVGVSYSGCGQVAFEEEAGLLRVMEMDGSGIMLTVD